MARVSGCEVKEVRGDQALSIGILKCAKSKRRRPAREARVQDYECTPLRGTELKGINQVSVELDCTPE